MIKEPTLSSLFHELFHTEWPDDDPQFASEVANYESAIHRLLALDTQLSHFIRTQPLLDCDQLTATGIVTGARRVVLSAGIEGGGGGAAVFAMSTSPVSIGAVFRSVEVDCGSARFGYSDGDAESDCITAALGDARAATVTCRWRAPLWRVSPELQKITGIAVGASSEIAQRVLQHIEANELLCDSGDEVRCDSKLKALTKREKVHVCEVSGIIKSNIAEVEDLKFTLDSSSRSVSFQIHVPVLSSEEVQKFRPVELREAPVREYLKTAIESKEQLTAISEFTKAPLPFMEEMVLREARQTDCDDISNSSFLFMQPWLLDSASDFLRVQEYNKLKKRQASSQPTYNK